MDKERLNVDGARFTYEWEGETYEAITIGPNDVHRNGCVTHTLVNDRSYLGDIPLDNVTSIG